MILQNIKELHQLHWDFKYDYSSLLLSVFSLLFQKTYVCSLQNRLWYMHLSMCHLNPNHAFNVSFIFHSLVFQSLSLSSISSPSSSVFPVLSSLKWLLMTPRHIGQAFKTPRHISQTQACRHDMITRVMGAFWHTIQRLLKSNPPSLGQSPPWEAGGTWCSLQCLLLPLSSSPGVCTSGRLSVSSEIQVSSAAMYIFWRSMKVDKHGRIK